jgi:phosphoglycolate phosphatase-like HAD superfamily hydrolase
MKNRVLIFDFDGTIADTFAAIVEITNQLADEYNFRKITMPEAEIMKDNTLKEAIHQLNIPILKIPIIVTKAKSALFKDIATITPVSGLKEILVKLNELGVQMGILTSNSTQNVGEFLKNHGLEIFDFVNSTSKIWSKDLNLKKMIVSYNLNIDDVIYIGDEARDVEAAKRLGIKVAAVTWGYNSAKALAVQKPDYLLTRPEELLNLLS